MEGCPESRSVRGRRATLVGVVSEALALYGVAAPHTSCCYRCRRTRPGDRRGATAWPLGRRMAASLADGVLPEVMARIYESHSPGTFRRRPLVAEELAVRPRPSPLTGPSSSGPSQAHAAARRFSSQFILVGSITSTRSGGMISRST
jgi:hypothetical protein